MIQKISLNFNNESTVNSINPGESFVLHETHFKDQRSWLKKAYHKILSIIKDIFYGIFMLYNRIKGIPPSIKNPQWKKDNKGLCLFIHGLKGTPSDWNQHIKEIKKRSSNYAISAPSIPKRGNCSLKEASDPVLEIVKDYIKKFPNNPISIFATSNGARIAAYLDIHLRHCKVNMKISSIAGACYGSKLATFIKKVPIIHRILHKDIKEELYYASPQVKSVITAMREKSIIDGSRSYDFYASSEDPVVTPFYSCFPIINQNENYYLVNGYGHLSIVGKVKTHQINKCLSWMKKVAIKV